eukprot:scaffold2274_cov343-Pavlova_lutheri.AAC.8
MLPVGSGTEWAGNRWVACQKETKGGENEGFAASRAESNRSLWVWPTRDGRVNYATLRSTKVRCKLVIEEGKYLRTRVGILSSSASRAWKRAILQPVLFQRAFLLDATSLTEDARSNTTGAHAVYTVSLPLFLDVPPTPDASLFLRVYPMPRPSWIPSPPCPTWPVPYRVGVPCFL